MSEPERTQKMPGTYLALHQTGRNEWFTQVQRFASWLLWRCVFVCFKGRQRLLHGAHVHSGSRHGGYGQEEDGASILTEAKVETKGRSYSGGLERRKEMNRNV